MKTVLTIEAETLPHAWEQAIIELGATSQSIQTQYDQPGDPFSKDMPAVISVTNPMAEPRVHLAMPGGFKDLWKYREEVVNGVHDHWCDPGSGKWSYTYHQRFANYPDFYADDPQRVQGHDQLATIAVQLAQAPFTRRAQAITWIPRLDQYDSHPPCLQRVWFRVVDNKLNMHIHIRSNDALKAGFMNMFAFTEIQADMAERVSSFAQREIPVGTYIHIADSWHIYGSDFQHLTNFFQTLKMRDFQNRVCSTTDESFLLAKEEAIDELSKERKLCSTTVCRSS